MKSEKNILIAFLLNLFFSIFEIVGALFTNSVAILSDAIHDLFDSLSIGLSFFLEKKSKKKPDDIYTYGYARYSVLGALITTIILFISSILIIYHSIERIFNPQELNYVGMFIISIFGVVINFLAAYFTREGDSLNQKAVNLHMFEDVLGWVIVLIGSILIKFTKILWIDSVISIIVSTIIVLRTINHLNQVLDLFLMKKPIDIDVDEIKKHILNIKGVKDIHHIHVWSLDGINNFATLHVVSDKNIKDEIRKELKRHDINNVTIELEDINEVCHNKCCKIDDSIKHHHHHH